MNSIVVQHRAHTRLSPSMMGRVEKCTASYFLSPPEQERVASEAAAYGTAAHEVSERLLREGALSCEYLDSDIEADGFTFVVDDDMLSSVDVYVDVCRELQSRYASTLIEQRMSLSPVFPDRKDVDGIKGLVDFGAFDPAQDVPYVVVDYKSGWAEVGADALQVILYGLMLVGFVGGGTSLRKPDQPLLKTVIVQPAQGAPKEHVWTAGEVEELKRRVALLLDNVARRNFFYEVGDHCTFCPVVGVCPHLRAVAKDAALAKVVPDPALIVDGTVRMEDIDDDLQMIPLLEKWIRARVEIADSYLKNGGNLENAALKRGRANRRWKNEEGAETYMRRQGVDPYVAPKLKSPNQAEKALPADLRDGLKSFWEKPEGDLKIALGKVDPSAKVNLIEGLRRAQESNLAGRLLAKAQESIV